MTYLTGSKISGLLLTLFALCGCAGGLSVQVDVLDKTYMDSMVGQDELRSEAMSISKGNFKHSAQFMGETTNLLGYYRFNACRDEAKRLVTPLLPQSSRPTYLSELKSNQNNTLGGKVALQLNNMRDRLNLVDNEVRQGINKHYSYTLWDTYRKKSLPPRMLELLSSRRAKLDSERNVRRELLKRVVNNCKKEIISDIVEVNKAAKIATEKKSNPNYKMDEAGFDAVQVATINNWTNKIDLKFIPYFRSVTNKGERSLQKKLFGGGSLLATQEGVFHVVNAEKRYWAPMYNEAFGSGVFGNTTTAIKVNGLADYTVKGFSFDGRSTANMVRKLGLSTVGFAAAMGGVPIDLTSNGASKDPNTVFEGSAVSTAQTALSTDKAKTKAYKSSIKRVARQILAHKGDLSLEPESEEQIKARIYPHNSVIPNYKLKAVAKARAISYTQRTAKTRAMTSIHSTYNGYKVLLNGN